RGSSGDAAVRALGGGPERVAAIFLFTMSNSAVFFVPAARCCARVLLVSVPSTPTRGERSAERRKSLLSRVSARDVPCLARRGGRPAGRARLSALHRGDFGPGAALPSPAFPPDCAASSSQPGRNAWRAGSRASRGRRLRAAAAGRHSPLRLRLVSGDGPSDERGYAKRSIFP